MLNHNLEIRSGERFGFGSNWKRFLSILNEERIEEAKKSLRTMFGVETMEGKTLLDVGSGSGMFSLAARMLGAKVHSFDYDPDSVDCTRELRRRYFPSDDWIVEEGSVLDKEYLSNLGQFDYVYSWGVLHHTGDIWNALSNITPLVNSDGKLFIAIYNDQGRASKNWLFIKKLYNKIPSSFHFLILIPTFLRLWLPTMIREFLNGNPFKSWNLYINQRGMSPWYDVVDWVGGYPFEVAKPEDIFNFCLTRGFFLEKLKTCAGGLGCNEFVFRRL
jgi:2-polyprenyl-3-methyl-5-hydroxy-6-metoxy-1,4-benzoquinol methylase